MKAEQKIIDYLMRHGRSKNIDIHDHMERAGVKRKTSQKALSILSRRGIVARFETKTVREYWLREGAELPVEQSVFDQCREVSIGYQITKMLRVTKSSWEVSQ